MAPRKRIFFRRWNAEVATRSYKRGSSFRQTRRSLGSRKSVAVAGILKSRDPGRKIVISSASTHRNVMASPLKTIRHQPVRPARRLFSHGFWSPLHRSDRFYPVVSCGVTFLAGVLLAGVRTIRLAFGGFGHGTRVTPRFGAARLELSQFRSARRCSLQRAPSPASAGSREAPRFV